MIVGERDALHIPVICVIAHKDLWPGERVGVGYLDENTRTGKPMTCDGHDGIVDPFGEKVSRGQKCTVMLPPDNVTNVRHEWEYKNEPPDDVKAGHTAEAIPQEARISDLAWEEYRVGVAEKVGVDPETLQQAAYYVLEHGDAVGGYQPTWKNDPSVDWAEFWQKFNARYGTDVQSTEDPFCC